MNEVTHLPLWINVNNVHFLELLKDITSNRTTALAEVWGPTSISLAPTIDLLESTNSNTLPQVDLSCHGSCGTELIRQCMGHT